MTFTVLVVDDNFDHRFLTKRALRALEADGRVRVVVAEDGEAALALLAEGLAPGLMLLDIKMPRRDGFEVLAEIRRDARLRGFRVVMFSSSENKADVERARELGADDYVTKPLDAAAFQQQVRSTVETWLARAR